MDSVTCDASPSSTEPPSCTNGEEPPGKPKDWHWQLRNCLTSVADILVNTGPLDSLSERAAVRFPVSITPYYFSLIQCYDSVDPIFKMCMPQEQELSDGMCSDPLSEDSMMPVPNLIHRYRDRALIVATTSCSMYCRYCTRKRAVGLRDFSLHPRNMEQIVEYLRAHPEIKDVILSGGDPLTLGTSRVDWLLNSIRQVESVEIIRIGTKVPVVLPMRIDEKLVKTLRKYAPLFVNTHFNHPNEITKESKRACAMLVDHGIPINNQSVLLRGVNDDKYVQEKLCRELIKMRVRPYYLFQCDIVNGVEHFRTKVSQGIEIMDHLRGRLSGMAIPQYVIDSPGGKGKIPILPNYIMSQTPTKVVLRNYQGEMVEYPEVA